MSQLRRSACPTRLPARTDLVAIYFPVLASRPRLRIPQPPQAEDELPAGELTRQLAHPQPRVSDHLACLRWRSFVTTRHDVAARCRIHKA